MAIVFEGRPLEFAAPGPGSWEIDTVHVPRPWSRFQCEVHSANLPIGFRDCARRYGWLMDTLRFESVHGFIYASPAPPPDEEVPARFAAAAQAIETRLWRRDLARWLDDVKPATIRAQLALQAIDPAMLDDAALAAHIDRCRGNLERMVQQHHRFNAAALHPVDRARAPARRRRRAPGLPRALRARARRRAAVDRRRADAARAGEEGRGLTHAWRSTDSRMRTVSAPSATSQGWPRSPLAIAWTSAAAARVKIAARSKSGSGSTSSPPSPEKR